MTLWIPNQKSIPVLKDDSCTRCSMELPVGITYCPRCGPPEPPEETPRETLGMGQALFRIIVVLVLFSAFVIYKSDTGSVEDPKPELEANEGAESVNAGKPLNDSDFKLTHTIKVPFANIRLEATVQSEVLTVLKKGDEVKLVKKGETWSQIQVQGKTGWIATHLLEASVR